jgi:alanine racemase
MAYISINKQNFYNNLEILTQKTKSKDKLAIVLKDNAYGHGLEIMAKLSNKFGLSKAVVRTQNEALKIERLFDYILVLADIPKNASKNIRYTINDINDIKKFPPLSKVELKIDTGMHRNGIMFKEIDKALSLIKKQNLQLEAVFTHHRSADELTSEWFWQNENFKKVKEFFKDYKQPLRFHSANSASLLRTKNFDEDMARVGIAAYGCIDLPKEIYDTNDLKPVLSVYAKKISTKKLKKGFRIGYGGSCALKNDLVISNYDFGYGDSFLRCLSNNFITKNNEKLIGRISMDNSSFNSKKDEILIFDNAIDIAKQANTISYEILTSLKSHLKRVLV